MCVFIKCFIRSAGSDRPRQSSHLLKCFCPHRHTQRCRYWGLLISDRRGLCVCVQASNTVEVNFETAERLQVSRLDFMTSLNNDIKPVSSYSSEQINRPPPPKRFLCPALINHQMKNLSRKVYIWLRCLSSCPGIRHQSGGLRQLRHERDHPLGRPGVDGPGGWRAAGSADEEQRPHAAGVSTAGG